MKKTLSIALSIIASVSSIHAAAITFSGSPVARQILAQDGLTPIVGGLVMVGTFADESKVALALNLTRAVSQNFSNISSTAGWAQFAPLAATQVTSSTGRVGTTWLDDSTTADAFNSKPLFLWVFNGTTIANSTQFGIFRSSNATTPWVFPNNGNPPGIGDKTTLGLTVGAAPSVEAIGGAGFGSTTTAGLRLVSSVPEPGSATLIVLGAVAFASRRRRA